MSGHGLCWSSYFLNLTPAPPPFFRDELDAGRPFGHLMARCLTVAGFFADMVRTRISAGTKDRPHLSQHLDFPGFLVSAMGFEPMTY